MTKMSNGVYGDGIVKESELFSSIYSLAPFPMKSLDSLRKKYQDVKPKELTQIKPSRSFLNWLPNFAVGTPRSSSFTVPKIPDETETLEVERQSETPVRPFLDFFAQLFSDKKQLFRQQFKNFRTK